MDDEIYNVEFTMEKGSFEEFMKKMCEGLEVYKHSFESGENMMGCQFFDYITDLNWIKTSIINISVHCSNCNEKFDSKIFEYILDMINFWNNNAEHCIVGGKRKIIKFNLIP